MLHAHAYGLALDVPPSRCLTHEELSVSGISAGRACAEPVWCGPWPSGGMQPWGLSAAVGVGVLHLCLLGTARTATVAETGGRSFVGGVPGQQ